jgi:carbon monoxide dehydrogenase subunit G
MPRYCASIHTPTDPPAAFAYLSRFDRAAEWDPGVADGEMLTDAPVGLGSRFRLVARFLGRSIPLDYEIVEFEDSTRLVLQAETGTIRSTDTITFSSSGSGTLVRYEAVLEAKGWARVTEPVLAAAFRHIADRAAAGLRAYMSTVRTP